MLFPNATNHRMGQQTKLRPGLQSFQQIRIGHPSLNDNKYHLLQIGVTASITTSVTVSVTVSSHGLSLHTRGDFFFMILLIEPA